MSERAIGSSRAVAESLRLFSEKGFQATTVDEIAQASGISRRTFFRQYRAKEDVVFADHEQMLEDLTAFLDAGNADPWDAVCAAAVQVFERFAHGALARLRYSVVREVPALRDREIVTVFRYERLFADHLRKKLPAQPDLDVVQFAASVTATHNFLLRRKVRGDAVTTDEVRRALAAIARPRMQ